MPRAVGSSLCSEIHLHHRGLNGQGFSSVTRKSDKEQGPRSPCFLLCYGTNTVKVVLWVNHKGFGVSSQMWGQLSFASLALGELHLGFLKVNLE